MRFHESFSIEEEESLMKDSLSLIPTMAEGEVKMRNLFESGQVFSFIRIGDSEALYALGDLITHPTDIEISSYCGTSQTNPIWRQLLIDTLKKTDYLGIQEAYHGRLANKAFWLPTQILVNKEDLAHDKEKIFPVHILYKMFSEPYIWNYLRGKKVMLVHSNPEFILHHFNVIKKQERFVDLNMDLNLCFPTAIPDAQEAMKGGMPMIESIIKDVKKTGPDIVLLACGMLAKISAVRIKEETGITSMDVGAVFDALIDNPTNLRRPFMVRFRN